MTSPDFPRISRAWTLADYLDCEAIQKEIWGFDDRKVIPQSIMLTANTHGGLVLLARERDGRPVGCLIGIAGIRDGAPIQCSQRCGVLDGHKGSGLALRMKLAQREHAIENRCRWVVWTFDPLVAVNAAFNFRKLGVRSSRYLRDLYGESSGPLHAGLPTDRLYVEWEVESPEVIAILSGASRSSNFPAEIPCANPSTDRGRLPVSPEPRLGIDAPAVAIEVPGDIGAVKTEDLGLARDWRMKSRAAFEAYLARGYQITGFGGALTGRISRYLLERR